MKSMDLQRLSELLDAYGASRERWPAAEREAALSLLASSDAARALHRQAQMLDAELDALAVPPPGAALRAAVIASIPQHRRGWVRAVGELWRELGGWRLAAPAFAASLALGALLPIWLDETAPDLPEEDLIAAMQLTDELPEWTP